MFRHVPAPERSAGGEVVLPESRSAQTTRRLLEAAAEEFIERGYEAARVSEVARRAGVTSGAAYARWRDKTEVMVAALDYIFEQILPNRRLETLEGEMQPPDLIVMLGECLLEHNDRREVLVQVFGSARNNEKIRHCLQRFLNEEADEISRIIDQGKQDGFADPQLSTAAMSLLCQATALGVRLLVLAELDDRHVPTPSEWNELLTRLVGSAAPPDTATP